MKQFKILKGSTQEIESKMNELYMSEIAGEIAVVPLGFSSDDKTCYQPVIIMKLEKKPLQFPVKTV